MDTINARTKKICKIDEWLQTNIINWLNIPEISCLLVELEFLQDTLPEQFRSALKSEHHALSEWIKTKKIDSTLTESGKLQIYESGINQKMFLKEMKKRHQYMKELYLITFLVSRSDSLKINTIRSLYFFICLKMVELTDYDSRIETTLDECRFLTSNIREFLVPFLPDITQFRNLQDLQSYLIEAQNNDHYNRWLNRSPQSYEHEIQKYKNKLLNTGISLSSSTAQFEINKRIAQYLYEYILPIENCFKNESGITRNVKQAEKLVDGSEYIDETTGNSVNDLILVSEIANDDSAFEADERQDDEDQAFEQVTIAQPTNYYLDKVRAEQQVNCRHQRSMSQATDVNNAHPDDIKILVNNLLISLLKLNLKKLGDCHDQNDTDIEYSLDHQAALYLLMLLLTGLADVFVSKNLKLSYQSYQYPLTFAPTRSKIQDNWNVDLCANNENSLKLFFPEIIGKLHHCIANGVSSEAVEQVAQRASDQLKSINKQNKTRLTINKVENYLSHFLTQEGRDIALIEVLTNRPINHQSALPYFNVSQYDLFSCQYDFTKHLSDMLDERNLLSNYAHQFFTLLEEKATGYWDKQMGSVLAVKENGLKNVVSRIQDKLQERIDDRRFSNAKSMVELHNIFIDYLYIMLSISSGYRPVREPFGRLSHIDTRTRNFFISDKENHQDTRGRFIYLPNIANEQIKKYIQYLQKNVGILIRLDDPLGDIYSKILESNIGLITYLNFDCDTGTITEIRLTKNYIHERLSMHINLPLNWHRHFIRSLKHIEDGLYSTTGNSMNKGFGYDVIGSWMGHTDSLGFNFYNRYSGLKRNEVKRFASYLNEVLEEIGFKVIQLEGKV